MKTRPLTYKRAGVDINEGDRFVKMITPLARKTFRPGVISDIGSFGALFRLDRRKYREPVLVSGTDGVGTKLKVAFMVDRHDTVGIDLVAMCVNDILTSGAEPLFFLDYFATGKLKSEKAAEVVKGIVEGCRQSGCALIGGETAEMPDFYGKGEYDLSGFAVGVVDQGKIIDGRRIKAGDAIIGVASSGLHSNGYSLVRKVFFEARKTSVRKILPETGRSLGEELLKPTRIYAKAFNALSRKVEIKGMAHITGGGIPGNLPRIFPEGKGAIINQSSWPVLPIFEIIQDYGGVPDEDMKHTFNMGIGFIFVVDDGRRETSLRILRRNGFDSYLLGYVEKGIKGVRFAKG
ncbi:MAG: phosphoribosylformylglycinamidine cyclo-ligase [Candidatus Sulfobium sp.]